MHHLAFVACIASIDQQVLGPLLAKSKRFVARVLVPMNFRWQERSGDHIESSVAIDIEQVVAIALDVAIPIVDAAQRTGSPVTSAKPIPARHQIGDPIAIDVARGDPFIGIQSQESRPEKRAGEARPGDWQRGK